MNHQPTPHWLSPREQEKLQQRQRDQERDAARTAKRFASQPQRRKA